MKGFESVDLIKAYELLNGANVALVCTKGKNEGQYNVTPYGWFTTYDYEPVTKVLFSSDPAHQALANVERTKEFAICVPSDENADFIEKCGTVSNPDADKFKMFDLKGAKASAIDVNILPENSKAIIEFKLIKVMEESTVKLILGEAVAAWKKN